MAPKFTFDSIPSLTGKVAIVTGGNAGIGLIVVRELANNGCKVYVFTRSKARFDTSIETLPQKVKSQVHFVACDLSDLESVKAAAETFKSQEQRLDILVNNGGIMAVEYSLSKQGLEIQQATNAVGPAVLTFSLLDILVSTARNASGSSRVRIIQTSSSAHQRYGAGPPDQSWDNLELVNRKQDSTWKRYGQSKVANILLADHLSQILIKENIVNVSLNPGNVNTGLYNNLDPALGFAGKVLSKVIVRFLITPEKGAVSTLYAATSTNFDDSTQKLNGAYLESGAVVGKKATWATNEHLRTSFIRFVETFAQEKAGIDVKAKVEEALRR